MKLNLLIGFEGSGPDKSWQDKPHLHSVRYSPDRRFLFAFDLGTDSLYRLHATGATDEGQPVLSESGFGYAKK